MPKTFIGPSSPLEIKVQGMTSKRSLTLVLITLVMITLLFLTTISTVQAESLKEVLSQGAVGTKAAHHSQRQIDKLSNETTILLDKYQSAISEVDYLIPHIEQLRKQIKGQEAGLVDLKSAINEVQIIERQLGPLLEKMVNRLSNFIEVDKPFLLEERNQRVSYLRKALNDHDSSISDKFRQVMDAYEIEIEYGNTLESYNETIRIVDQDMVDRDMDVNVLKIGRIALVFQTADELTSGYWNEDTNKWEFLPINYRRSIRQGIRLTRNQATTELILTPISYDADKPSNAPDPEKQDPRHKEGPK